MHSLSTIIARALLSAQCPCKNKKHGFSVSKYSRKKNFVKSFLRPIKCKMFGQCCSNIYERRQFYTRYKLSIFISVKCIINKAEPFISKGIKLFCFPALFKNTLTLKFKSQLTYAYIFSLPSINLADLLGNNFTSAGSKGHGLRSVIGGFKSFLFVSVFQGSWGACDCNHD